MNLAHIIRHSHLDLRDHHPVVIILVGEGVKILPQKHFLNVGLGVEQADLFFLKTTAFPTIDIARILAFRAGVVHLHVIRRKSKSG